MTTPSPQDPKGAEIAVITHIPVEHMRSFLEFCIDKEPETLDKEDQAMARVVRELAAALAADIDHPLAWAIIDAIGANDLSDPDISRLYAEWAAGKLLGA